MESNSLLKEKFLPVKDAIRKNLSFNLNFCGLFIECVL